MSDTDQQTLEDAAVETGFKTEVAEYTETAAALARLEFRMKNVVHDVSSTKGMDAAKKDRAELRTLRTTLDKKRLELNADDQARIKTRNDEAKRITAAIEALEDPIDSQIKAEEQRKEDEKIARQRAEADRIEALRTRIDTMAGLALRSVGKPSAYVAEKIAMLEGMTTEDFEEMTPVAVNTKAETLAKLRELLATAQAHEKAVAELEASQQRESAQRAENERLEREAQQRRDAEAAAERQRREAEEAAERGRQAHAQAAAKFREAVSDIVMGAIGQTAGEIEAALFKLGKLAGEGARAPGQEAIQLLVNAKEKLEKMHRETLATEKLRAEETRRQQAEEAERRAQAQREQQEREAREAAEREAREAEARQQREAQAAEQQRLRQEAEDRAALLEEQVRAIPDVVKLLTAINADGTLAKSKKDATKVLAVEVSEMLMRIAPLPGGQYLAADGTLMNSDGTRSVFDDVAK